MTHGAATETYSYDAKATGLRPRLGHTFTDYGWTGLGFARILKKGHVRKTTTYGWKIPQPLGNNGSNASPGRFRVIVQETRGTGNEPGKILSDDLTVHNLIVSRQLSGWCDIGFDVDFHDPSVAGINFKPWAQYIHIEKPMLGRRRIWCSGIVQPSKTDPRTGILHLKAKGFADYPHGLPWLEDINWFTNDAFEPVVEIWRHLQNDFGAEGDLGVEIYPKTSGVEMLPGYAYKNGLLNLNFYATFVRATDKLDCGDYIDALAKDIPFDFAERQDWNPDRTDVIKKVELGYPRLGMIQKHLAFVVNENVLSAKPHLESDINWISDVIVDGWFPGAEYSAELANADPDRLRRVLSEEDAGIDSNERAQAWAHRRLARRQAHAYFDEITVDPDHPNAPFGSYDIGDTITVSGFMPWVGGGGYVSQEHKIMSIAVSEKNNQVKIRLKSNKEFNYDPIYYPGPRSNIIDNGAFDYGLDGWRVVAGDWSHDAGQGHNALGAAKTVADGTDRDLITRQYNLDDNPPATRLRVYVKCADAAGGDGSIALMAQYYIDGYPRDPVVIAAVDSPRGAVAWRLLHGYLVPPADAEQVALRLHVDRAMTAGIVWFDDAVLTL